MSIYDIQKFDELVKGNSYVGRGIIVGKSEDGKKAVTAYFIMGRSTNSRNRVFIETPDGIIIKPLILQSLKILHLLSTPRSVNSKTI